MNERATPADDESRRRGGMTRATRRTRPRLRGAVVGLVVLAVAIVPATFCAAAAWSSFTGCFLTCTAPEPTVGWGYTVATVALLACPVVAGVLTTRSARR